MTDREKWKMRSSALTAKIRTVIAMLLFGVMLLSVSGCGILEGLVDEYVRGNGNESDEPAHSAVLSPSAAPAKTPAPNEPQKETALPAETAPAPTETAQTVTNRQLIQGLTATASSCLVEDVASHKASNVLDNNLKTAWVENASGVGVGEWIQLSTKDGSGILVTDITFSLGFQATSQLLEENGWPTRVLLECAGGYEQEITFGAYDNMIELDEPVETSWIRITILEAEAGTKFEDTCICEIKVYGQD